MSGLSWSSQTTGLIHAAFDEDLGTPGDITSRLLDQADRPAWGRIVTRQAGVICGLALASEICAVFSRRLQRELEFAPAGDRPCRDGTRVAAGRQVASVRGPRAAVLALERTLLNFLGRMSGVATLTRRFVQAARRGCPTVTILGTRKTLPGWRELDRYAVACGGGQNHRAGLYDAVLLKDNHLAGVPSGRLAAAVSALLARRTAAAGFVAVEVDDLEQLAQVCKLEGLDLILLDNFLPERLRAAVAYRDAQGLRGKVALEASGRITLDNVAAVAASGVERISVGALTHSAASLDLGLDLEV